MPRDQRGSATAPGRRWRPRAGRRTAAYRFAGVEARRAVTRCAALCASRPATRRRRARTAGRVLAHPPQSAADGLVHVISPPASQPVHRAVDPRLSHGADHLDDEIVHRHRRHPRHQPTAHGRQPHALPADQRAGLSDRVCALSNELCTDDDTVPRCRTPEHARATVGSTISASARREGAGPGPRVRLGAPRSRCARQPRASWTSRARCKETLPGYGNVRFDMAIPSIQWVLEVDVHPEHRTVEGQTGDCRRDRRTRRSGWFVDRVGEAELTIEFDATLDDVVASVELRRQEVARLAAAGLWPLR